MANYAAADDPGDPLSEIPLTTYGRRIGRHILIDHSGLGQPRGPTLDPTPWSAVAQKIRTLLRDADSNRLRIEAIRSALKSDTGVDPDLIDDTLRMFASMGAAKTYADAGGTWYSASPAMEEGFSRRHYLSTFSDELLAKSRRIDHLIRHTGTVGTYREELLRSTIRQLLPTRYQANTGFIENSPRQLDIIVWDAGRYSPLFKEGEVVIVPLEAARAIIEVKTTLDTGALDAALEILHDTLRTHPSVVPIFRGVFAFHPGYDSDRSVAERIQSFHTTKDAPPAIVGRSHSYLYDGVTAVCVPNQTFVFQVYQSDKEKPDSFPRPWLFGIESDWTGDMKTAAFLARLLDYLDVDARRSWFSVVCSGRFGWSLHLSRSSIYSAQHGGQTWLLPNYQKF